MACGSPWPKIKKAMTDKEAIKILHYAQKWRRGANVPMPDPKEYGEAIDHAIKTLRKGLRQKLESVTARLSEEEKREIVDNLYADVDKCMEGLRKDIPRIVTGHLMDAIVADSERYKIDEDE